MVWNIFESHKLAIGRLYFEKQMVDGCVTQVVISCSEVGSNICLYRFVNGRLYRSNCFNSFFLLAETFNYFLKPLKTGFINFTFSLEPIELLFWFRIWHHQHQHQPVQKTDVHNLYLTRDWNVIAMAHFLKTFWRMRILRFNLIF